MPPRVGAAVWTCSQSPLALSGNRVVFQSGAILRLSCNGNAFGYARRSALPRQGCQLDSYSLSAARNRHNACTDGSHRMDSGGSGLSCRGLRHRLSVPPGAQGCHSMEFVDCCGISVRLLSQTGVSDRTAVSVAHRAFGMCRIALDRSRMESCCRCYRQSPGGVLHSTA